MKSLLLKCGAAAVIGLAPALYVAPASAVTGYVTTGPSNAPVRDGFGQCIRSADWHEGMRYADCEPAPAPVAQPAPAPAPVVVVEAPAPVVAPAPVLVNVPFKVALDELFAFDDATLSPAGKAALDDLARRLAATRYDTLTIVGHADRIGGAAYNQKLSERRAAAMRDYLVAAGVDAGKIVASGVGKSQPTAQCTGLRGKPLIACLQPDRNAVLTASGTEVLVSQASQ